MDSYYLILRLRPAIDIQGKSEAEILKKIEANYKALVARLKEHTNIDEKEKILKSLDEAKATLSDPKKREEYDKQLKIMEENSVTIEIRSLTDELIKELEQEIEEEEKNKDK